MQVPAQEEAPQLHIAGPEAAYDPQRRRPRRLSPEQRERFEGYAEEIFRALGMSATASTLDTPRRFIQGLLDATDGYEGDSKLVTTFPSECRGGPGCSLSQVVEGPIPYQALCEHHGFPFHGQAYVGYIARDRIIGISKLIRLVRLFSRRFTVQERMGVEIAGTLAHVLGARGVAVYLDGVHMCTRMRGVRDTEAATHTTHWRGSYEDDPALRAEFMAICQQRTGR